MCDYAFPESSVPAEQCSAARAKPSSWRYLMTASCVTDTVAIWGAEYVMSKGTVATIVVLFDLLISYFLWFALIAGKPF